MLADRKGPLKGLKVVELAHIMAGPVCGLFLADLGADVIKVEKIPGGDDSRRFLPPDIEGESAAFMMMNRNKRGIAIDLKTADGKAALEREKRELHQANEILAKASADFAQAAFNLRFKPCSRSSTIIVSPRRSSQSAGGLTIAPQVISPTLPVLSIPGSPRPERGVMRVAPGHTIRRGSPEGVTGILRLSGSGEKVRNPPAKSLVRHWFVHKINRRLRLP